MVQAARVVGLVAVVAAGVALGARQVPAATIAIAIDNASFEAPAINNPTGAIGGAPSGWQSSAGEVGVFQPVAPGGSYVMPIPNGVQVGYINGNGNLYQIVRHQLVAGASYTLEARIGDRTETAIGQYQIAFALEDATRAGDIAAVNILAWSGINPVVPRNGEFVTVTVRYTAPGTLDVLAGRNLVVLVQHVAGEGLTQVNIDQVALTQETPDARPRR